MRIIFEFPFERLIHDSFMITHKSGLLFNQYYRLTKTIKLIYLYQDTVFDVVSLTCSHIFCYMCACSASSVTIVDGLKAADSKAKCPLCREVKYSCIWFLKKIKNYPYFKPLIFLSWILLNKVGACCWDSPTWENKP